MIHEPLSPNAVFVAWRDPHDHRCYPVGRLARFRAAGGAAMEPDRVEYEFAYVRGVEHAKQAGFSCIRSFEDVRGVYRSDTLFPFFANRLMANGRPELPALLDHLLLRSADALEVLARTGGIRATDTYEVFPLPRFDPQMPGFRTLFLVHALRHFPPSTFERITRLQLREPLYLMQDCQNRFDPRAMALRTEDRILVGHVPHYLLLEVYDLASLCDYVEVTVAKVNPAPAPLDQRLLCAMDTCWPDDYQPFVDDRFQPFAEGAVPTQELIRDYAGGAPLTAR